MIATGITPEECRFLEIKKHGKMKIYDLYFGSISEVEVFLSSAPTVNARVFASQASINAPQSFAGPPLPEAIAYCVGGYEENYTRFLELSGLLKSADRIKAPSRCVEPSFVGHRPNIPAYIADAPKNMYRNKRVAEKKVINVFMQVTFDKSTTDTQILHRGILTLNLIRLLEENGYIVRFRVFEVCFVYDEIFKCEIVLKQTAEKLDPRKCYYPMCGKAFVRRVLSRIKESMPFRENWHMSYGIVAHEKFTRSIINAGPNDIYIGTPKEMGITGLDLYADANAFLAAAHLSDNIRVPHYERSDSLGSA